MANKPKGAWDAEQMQGTLITEMQQSVKQGYAEMNNKSKVEESIHPTPSPSLDKGGELQRDVPAAVAIAQPGEPMQNINVPIPISLHSRLKIMAAQQRINMKNLVALAIKEYVEKQS